MTLYRQKNFFNRWKHKSSSTRRTGHGHGGYGPGASRHYNSSPASARHHNVRVDVTGRGAMASRESIPLRVNGARSHPPSPRRLEEIATAESDFLREDPSASISVSGRSSMRACYSLTDSGVQTDDELLQSLVCNLRKRVISGSGSNNTSKVGSHVRKASYTSTANRENLNDHSRSGGPFDRDKAVVGPTEQDCLLGLDRNRKVGASVEPHLLSTSEQLPLLSSGDHSPLTDEQFLCDSTSEETLSDQEFVNPLDEDIEDVLSGACSIDGGSLGSLCISDFELPGQSDNRRVAGRSHRLPHTVHLNLQSTAIGPAQSQLAQSPSSEETCSLVDEALQHGKARRRSRPVTNSTSKSHRSSIPEIQIDKASSGDRLGARGLTVDTADQSSVDGHTGSVSDSRRSSAASSGDASITSSNERPSLNNSASPEEHASLQNLPEQHRSSSDSDSVSKFQQYLRSRGLNLDMTSVQSSDV